MGSNSLAWSAVISPTTENTSFWSILAGVGRLELPPHEFRHNATATISSENLPAVDLQNEKEKLFIRDNECEQMFIIAPYVPSC